MKIKIVKKPYDEVMALKVPKHKSPRKPSVILRTLINVISCVDLWRAKFKTEGELPPKSEGPCLILMNHSSFIDMQIAHRILFPRPLSIVCGYDAIVGKNWLMRWMGCIPTRKFISDIALIKDMKHALKNGVNVLMYPEAGYSFDGTATAIPKLGRLAKMLGVTTVFIKTEGAFLRDPLYNELRLRKVPVSAKITTLFTKEEAATLDTDEMDKRIDEAFTFDNFAWQRDNKIEIDVPFLCEGLERTLYRCPCCKTDGNMNGEGTKIICRACKKSYTMDAYGQLSADDGNTEFAHIPDWFSWERDEVRRELLAGDYSQSTSVDIKIMNDFKALYSVGEGKLVHTLEGFHLRGCDGKLDFSQKALASHSVNADYYWYEIGDTLCIGDSKALYYCFPKDNAPVAKLRLAAEELYKLHQDHDFHALHAADPKDAPITV